MHQCFSGISVKPHCRICHSTDAVGSVSFGMECNFLFLAYKYYFILAWEKSDSGSELFGCSGKKLRSEVCIYF